jgi:hypothetical protein
MVVMSGFQRFVGFSFNSVDPKIYLKSTWI